MKRSAVDLALLVIRLALGTVFIAHGSAKLFPSLWGIEGGGIEKFATSLSGMGVPLPDVMAYVVAAWELGGGILLVLGLATRIAALGILGTMFVAFVKVHMSQGFFLPPVGKSLGFEYVMVLGATALALVIAGAGQFALDPMVFKGKPKGP
jgi:putative oxidoreductase